MEHLLRHWPIQLNIWDGIMNNESEVGSDMLLVSDYFCTLNLCKYNLKLDTCEPLLYYGSLFMLIKIFVASTVYLLQVPSEGLLAKDPFNSANASLNGTFHLSTHENILTISLINIHYLYTLYTIMMNDASRRRNFGNYDASSYWYHTNRMIDTHMQKVT